jgi:hypothetical protein
LSDTAPAHGGSCLHLHARHRHPSHIALTGVPDTSGTTVTPGAYAESFVRLGHPKMRLGRWGRLRTDVDVSVFEVPPGHPDLPTLTQDSAPWPAEAGALGVSLTAATDWTELADALEHGAVGWFTTMRPVKFSMDENGAREISELDLRTIALKAPTPSET